MVAVVGVIIMVASTHVKPTIVQYMYCFLFASYSVIITTLENEFYYRTPISHILF